MRFSAVTTSAALAVSLAVASLIGCAGSEPARGPVRTNESSVDYVELERGFQNGNGAEEPATVAEPETTPEPVVEAPVDPAPVDPAPEPEPVIETPAPEDPSRAMDVPADPEPVVEVPSEPDPRAAEKALAARYASEAQAHYQRGDLAEALRRADMALELDPTNNDALALREEVTRVATGSSALYGPGMGEDVLRTEAQYEIRRRLTEAQRLLDAGRWTESIAAAESALDVIRWSGAGVAEDAARLRAGEIARSARERREASRSEDAAQIREQQRRNEEIEALTALNAYREEIRTLFREARDLFDAREYNYAVLKLEHILRKDPFNTEVQDLKRIAEQLQRGVMRQDAHERFNLRWQEAFAAIEEASVFPTRDLTFASAESWLRTNQRRDRVLREQNLQLDKADIQVRTALETVTIAMDVGQDEERPLSEILAEFRRVARIQIVATADAPSDAPVSDLELNPLAMRKVLDILAERLQFSWRVQHGALIIDGAETESQGGRVTRIFQVSDIIQPLRNFVADEPRLSEEIGQERFTEDTGGDDAGMEIDGEMLVELIQTTIDEDSWGEEAVAIRQRTLVVTNTIERVNRVEQLLADLRRSQGLVVNVEARFITVRDDFLEDIGLDFRGIGGSPAGANPVPVPAALDDVNFGTTNVPTGVGTDNEAGVFFQDINNNNSVNLDIRSRVENLFDRAVGGRRGGYGLTNFGGASFQFAFIDNPEINAVLRAVKKKERAVLLTAPSISVHNTQRGYVSILTELSYISDFEVNVSASAAIADPQVRVIRDGIVLDVRPTISADRRYVTLEMRPTLATLLRPIATIATSLGVGPPVSIQTPELQLQRIRTTVTIPDGGSFLIGGLRRMVENDLQSGVPILSDIPLIGWLFTRNAQTIERQDLIVIVSVAVMDLESRVEQEGWND